ncbi:hypothetical protein CDIK_2535 [Cucumispora dikerogammari]|nr:hypothetical protein CDIK_2535 [Cucumispora dikerogammari]
MEFTKKRPVKVSEERNTTRTINARQEYYTIINQVGDDRLVFLDKTDANLHHRRNYGFYPKNSKAIKVVSENRGENISSFVVIRKRGVLAFETKDGAFNGDSFIVFIRNKHKPISITIRMIYL